MRSRSVVILFILLMFASAQAWTIPDTLRSFNHERTHEYLNDKYYAYDDVPVDNSESALSRFLRNLFSDWFDASDLSAPNDIILYLLAAFILVIIFRNTRISFRSIFPAKGRMNSPSAVETSDHGETDYLMLFKQAEKNNMFSLAVRYRFLYLIGLLAERGWIIPEKHKTNREYARNIIDPAVKVRFISLAAIYDRTWYGEYQVDQHSYSGISKNFEQLYHQIAGS